MMKQNGLKAALVAALLTSVSLQSRPAHALFGIDEATRVEQFAQISLAEKDLEAMLQSIETLQLGSELAKIFEQMLGIQTVVEDVMVYEVPSELVQEYEIINPLKHKELTEARNKYLKEIDAEIAGLETEVALNPDQMETLTMAMSAIAEPRSNTVATQAQFLADQSQLEQERRKMAIEILKAKRKEIKEQIVVAHRISSDAAIKCIREKKSVDECN